MAYLVVPPKGEPTYCDWPCTHLDCAEWRKFFVQRCPLCGEGPWVRADEILNPEQLRKCVANGFRQTQDVILYRDCELKLIKNASLESFYGNIEGRSK